MSDSKIGASHADALPRAMTPFATSVTAKVRALHDLSELSIQLRQRLRESISDDIKKATNFHPHLQSVAAQWEASSRGITLVGKTWHDQPRFDPNRRLFVAEHKVTVGTLRERCISAPNESAVVDILVRDLIVVWVLREEDERLTRLGFRKNRPDPELAYRQAGIEVAST